MIPRRNQNSPVGGLLNFQGENSSGELVPAYEFTHVAARNAKGSRKLSLTNAGSVEVRTKIGHAAYVGTERTFDQDKVRSVRLGNPTSNWHSANMGLRIRELRKRKDLNLTGEQLAEIVGVTKGYISELENGKKTPGASLVIRLAEALKVEVYDLYEGTDAERKDASLRAHLDVMAQLPDDERAVIEKAALGLLAKRS